MQLKDRIVVGVIIITSLFGFKIYQNYSRNVLTNDDVNSIMITAEQSFIKAEAVVFKNKPVNPDDVPIGPDPDPDKCVCKGTGKIVQGDGHVTDCPYHKKNQTTRLKCKCDTHSTYCNCVNKHGHCSCNTTNTTIKRRSLFPLFRSSSGDGCDGGL